MKSRISRSDLLFVLQKNFSCRVNYADQNNGNTSGSPASPILSQPNGETQAHNRREHNTADDTGLSTGVYNTFDSLEKPTLL